MHLERTVASLPIASLTVVALFAAGCGEAPTTATSPTCSYRVTVQTQSFGPEGGSGTATVNTSAGCAWSAATTSDWISVARGTSGSGDGQVEFTVATYDGSADRTASLLIAKQNLSIAQTACAIRISPGEQTFSDAASARNVSLQAQPGCRWTLEGAPSWITLTPSTGTGETTVKLQVSENDIDAPREATIHAGSATLSVRQTGEPERCLFTLDVQPAQFNETGGHGIVAVNTREGCAWQLVADSEWIKASPSSGTGPARVSFNVSPITQPADRRALLRIDGNSAPVLQFANQCSFGVTPVQQYAHSYGESGTVAIRAGAGCAWTASPGEPWIHIDRVEGTGSGQIRFSVDRNPGDNGRGTWVRKAPIEIRWNTPTRGENAWIWQFSDCNTWMPGGGSDSTPGITNPARNVVAFPPEGGNAHIEVLVESPFSCQWTIENLPAAPFELAHADSFLGRLFEGDSNIHVTVPPNTTGQQRTTTMIVGEKTLTLTQPSK